MGLSTGAKGEFHYINGLFHEVKLIKTFSVG